MSAELRPGGDSLVAGGGQLDDEGGAQPLAVALGADRPPVELDQVTNDGKSDSEAAIRTTGAAVGLPETLEKMR